MWQCTPDNNSNIVNIVLFAYLGLLQFAAIILAVLTRGVKIKALNDTKYVVAQVYTSSITAIITATITLFVTTMINVEESLFSAALLFATTSFLCLTFIPKVIILVHQLLL